MRRLVTALVLILALAAPSLAAAQGRGGQGRKAAKARAGEKRVKKGPRFPAVTMYHVNHRETMSYRPYDATGKLRKTELQRFNRFMRDGSGKGGRVGKMHPRLATLFYRVARHFTSQGKRVEVISGYRPAARNSRSPHRKGLAVDFRVKGVSNAALRDYLRKSYDKVGVGYYPNSVFVHFDVRQKSAFWIDYSGPGQEGEYSADPVADLRSGRAEKYKPSKAEPPAADDDARAGTGEDGPPPGVETAEPPRKAEPAPGDENGMVEVKPAKPSTPAAVPEGKAAEKKPVEAKPEAEKKPTPAKQPAPEKKPGVERGPGP